MTTGLVADLATMEVCLCIIQLPGPKGGLYAWGQVRQYPEVILVEGLFDCAVLWEAGFYNLNYARRRTRCRLVEGATPFGTPENSALKQ